MLGVLCGSNHANYPNGKEVLPGPSTMNFNAFTWNGIKEFSLYAVRSTLQSDFRLEK